MAFQEVRMENAFEFLGLSAPWEIRKIEVDEDREHIRFQVGYVRGSQFHCPECGVCDQPVRDTRRKVWEDLRLGAHRHFISAMVPRIQCGHCGKLRMAEIPWARPRSGLTRRLEQLMLRMCIDTPARRSRIGSASATIAYGGS